MKVGLFIPCFIDQFYPHVGVATLEVLEKFGIQVEYPMKQTCCGQPTGNSGYMDDTKQAAKNFVNNFKDFEYIVSPSGSCTSFVKNHYTMLDQTPEVTRVRSNVWELTEFIHDIIKPESLDITFNHKVGIHNSCHGHRGLRLGNASETMNQTEPKIKNVLSLVKGIEFVELEKDDECCGFGGTFSVVEEAVSCKMGRDRVQDHLTSGAEIMTGADMSCLMHMEGLIKRDGTQLKVMHIAEILAGRTP